MSTMPHDGERESINVAQAVCGLFHGQEVYESAFSSPRTPAFSETEPGDTPQVVANQLRIPDDQILENLNNTQWKNGIAPTERLTSENFTVETRNHDTAPDTYLRTILELHKRFGFTKFVIMAPTKPRQDEISEYVNANRETFRNQYDRVIFCCENDASKHISRVRHFADSGTIEILALTTRSIAENQQNKLYKETERLGNERPIDLIRATHPIVLLDETTETDLRRARRTERTARTLQPLCILHYRPQSGNWNQTVYRDH